MPVATVFMSPQTVVPTEPDDGPLGYNRAARSVVSRGAQAYTHLGQSVLAGTTLNNPKVPSSRARSSRCCLPEP